MAGIRGNETITLRTEGINPRTDNFGTSNTKTATYILKLDEDNYLNYNTGLDVSSSTGHGSGFVRISKYDQDNQTISGTFEFEAINTNVADTINAPKVEFKKGIFYNVPIY